MSQQDPTERLVEKALTALPDWMKGQDRLLFAGRLLNVRCLLGTAQSSLLVSIRDGRIIDVGSAQRVMPSWQFAYRASPQAWLEYWKPMPKAGWHDILALVKIGEATLDGDLHPFMSHLQYFKDMLALPRGHVGVGS